MSDIATDLADQLLSAVGEQLAARGERFELVVIGGSALLALGRVERTTRDIDIVALRSGGELTSAEPLPESLRTARDLVARDFSLPTEWLNPGPTASRYDQIHFKLYATVDQGPGKHEADLRALEPTEAELIAAARWSRTQDPPEGYAQVLRAALASFGIEDADLQT